MMIAKIFGLIPNFILSCLGLNSYSTYIYMVTLPIAWYGLGLIDKDGVKKYMFNVGYFISQRFKSIPYWDKYAEPILIKQLSILFTAFNSFVDGMVSDNENKEEITYDLQSLEKLKLDRENMREQRYRKLNEIKQKINQLLDENKDLKSIKSNNANNDTNEINNQTNDDNNDKINDESNNDGEDNDNSNDGDNGNDNDKVEI